MTAATRGGGAVLGQSKAARAVATIVVGGALLAGGCQTDREITEPEPVAGHRGAAHRRAAHRRTTCRARTSSTRPPSRRARAGAGARVRRPARGRSTPRRPPASIFTGTGSAPPSPTRSPTTRARAPRSPTSTTTSSRTAPQVVVTDEGMRFTTKPLDFGVLSDDTLPLVVSIEHDDGTIEERNLIIMRAGDLISTIRLDGPRPSDQVRARHGHPRRHRQPRAARPGPPDRPRREPSGVGGLWRRDAARAGSRASARSGSPAPAATAAGGAAACARRGRCGPGAPAGHPARASASRDTTAP